MQTAPPVEMPQPLKSRPVSRVLVRMVAQLTVDRPGREESEASHEDVTLATNEGINEAQGEKTVLLTATNHLRWEITEGGREAG